jgi:rod shape-determining protein MreB
MRLGHDLGVDLGTSTLVVFLAGKGIVLNEPSVVAVDKTNQRVLAIGEEARQMLGKTPGNIIAHRPLKDGVIADYTLTRKMLHYVIVKVCRARRFFRPRMIICVPSCVTNVERKAALEAAYEAGAKKAVAIEEPMAAAIGAGLPISFPGGNMVIDVGGGTTDIAVISLGGIVVSESVRIAGNEMDAAIVSHIRKVHDLAVGEGTAEEVKFNVGSAYPLEPELEMEVRGLDMLTGLPKTIVVTSNEIREALSPVVNTLVDKTKALLSETPPELAADIILRGIVLTGGGSLLRGFDRLLEKETGIATRLADDPILCVARGTGKALEQIDKLESSLGLAAF